MSFFDLFKNLSTPAGGGLVSLTLSRRIKDDWENIEVLLRGGAPSQLRQALITADKALDNALKDVVSGESMAERMKNASNRFDRFTYQKLWDAHKLRNSLVHEVGFDPQHFVIREAVNTIKTALRNLGIGL